MDKINRPPVQCTVRRNGDSPRLPKHSDARRTTATFVFTSDGTIPAPIQEHMDKVNKMRIYDDEPSARLQ